MPDAAILFLAGCGTALATGLGAGARDAVSLSSPARSSPTHSAYRLAQLAPGGVASFQCRLDGGGWKACSPAAFTVKPGHHVFRVRALSASGAAMPARPVELVRRPSSAPEARPARTGSAGCSSRPRDRRRTSGS